MRSQSSRLFDPLGPWAEIRPAVIQAQLGGLAEQLRGSMRQVARHLERTLPANWQPDHLGWRDLEAVEEPAFEHSLALVWVPRGEIVRRLVDAEPEELEDMLLEHRHEVLEDAEAVLNQFTTASLTARRDPAAEPLACAVEGRWGAAQTLATAI